jgi:hypothetical protein
MIKRVLGMGKNRGRKDVKILPLKSFSTISEMDA